MLRGLVPLQFLRTWTRKFVLKDSAHAFASAQNRQLFLVLISARPLTAEKNLFFLLSLIFFSFFVQRPIQPEACASSSSKNRSDPGFDCHPQSTPRAPAHDAPAFTTFHT